MQFLSQLKLWIVIFVAFMTTAVVYAEAQRRGAIEKAKEKAGMNSDYDCQALRSHLQNLDRKEAKSRYGKYNAYLFVCDTEKKIDLINDLLKNLNNQIERSMRT